MRVKDLRKRMPDGTILFIQDEKGRHIAGGSNILLRDSVDRRRVVKMEIGYHQAVFSEPVLMVTTKGDGKMGIFLAIVGAATLAYEFMRLIEKI